MKTKKFIALLLTAAIVIAGICTDNLSVEAGDYDTVLSAPVSSPSGGCCFVGIQGSYISEEEAALKRINEIRKEACEEGIENPSTGKKLTPSDYVPIKWSSDLEYIAKIRAAEAAIIMDHTRPNGNSCFSLSSPNGEKSWGEVLAWNFSSSMITGINQWYEEKKDWVEKTGAVTGHYTQMIDPEHLYVGLGTFISDTGCYPNSTAGEFSFKEGLDSTPRTAEKNVTQLIEIQSSYIGKAELAEITGNKSTVGNTQRYSLLYNIDIDGKSKVCEVGTIEWSSSNPEIASIDSEGSVVLQKSGIVTISANGTWGSSSKEIKVKAKKPGKVKIIKTQNKKNSIKLKWNKVAGATGYEIVYSENDFWATEKKKRVSKNYIMLSGLAPNTSYKITIRAYTKTEAGTTYGDRTSVTRKTKK